MLLPVFVISFPQALILIVRPVTVANEWINKHILPSLIYRGLRLCFTNLGISTAIDVR
jgi:hypothetical protein